MRQALRREYQHLLDALFLSAKKHEAPPQLADHATPFEATLMAMLIEIGHANEDLNSKAERLEAEVKLLKKHVYKNGLLWS